jgi:predicted ATPase
MASRELPTLATMLRRHRVTAGLSQEALAERSGLSVRGVSDLERGLSRAPRLDTLTRLADALELDAAGRLALVRASGHLSPEADPEDTLRQPQPAAARPGGAVRSLPGYLTALIGREHDQAAIARLLRDRGVRLLTLTGPGGVGKTRLAVKVAEGLTDLCPSGVRFVALAPVTETALVLAAIAETIGVVDLADSGDVEALVLAIGAQQLLLVLDNFEQVLAAAQSVVALLYRCPNLRIIVTSRTALAVSGEQVYLVRPLRLPSATKVTAPETVGTWPGVALFIERAQAVQATFALNPANVEAVIAICRRLDGLPLALELAAARIAMLPPHALLTRLEHALPLLTSADRGAPSRHRTLRDAVAWSYDLLGLEERQLFISLGVFAGGWQIATASALWADMFNAEDQVIAGLATLLNQSLIQYVPPPDGTGIEPRYFMLETIREFAIEQLVGSGRAQIVRDNHARVFLRVAEEAEPNIRSERRGPFLPHLDAELDNLRAALTWSASDAGDAEVGLRIVGSLWGYFYLRGLLQEGRNWAERLLGRNGSADRSAGRARGLYALGALALLQGDAALGEASLDQSASLMRATCDPRLREVLTHLGWARTNLGRPAEALAVLRESTEIAHKQGDSWWMAYNFATEATALARAGDLSAAARRSEDSRALWDEHGDAWGRAIAERGLAGLRALEGHLVEARSLYAESASVLREVGDWRSLAQTLLGHGRAALQQGDASAAQAIYAEALETWQRIGIIGGSIRSLAGMAAALTAQARYAEATWLFAVVQAHAAPPPLESRQEKRWISEARSRLGEAEFAKAWTSGLVLTLDQAVPRALALPKHRQMSS